MNTDRMIEDFATARRILPREAMSWARDNWDDARPILLTLADDYASGRDRSRRTADILFFAIFMFADRGETAGFTPLCALARDPHALDPILGDGITESLRNIVVRIWDGDERQLKSVIECLDGDPYVRSSYIDALCYLALTDAIESGAARAYLRNLHDDLRPGDDPVLWDAWAWSYLRLGGEDALDLIVRAFDAGCMDRLIADLSDYQEAHASLAYDRRAAIAFDLARGAPLTDAIAVLSKWHAFSGAADLPGERPKNSIADVPAYNPNRDVGRNDPCPCGSGKKYKKCCLPKAPFA